MLKTFHLKYSHFSRLNPAKSGVSVNKTSTNSRNSHGRSTYLTPMEFQCIHQASSIYPTLLKYEEVSIVEKYTNIHTTQTYMYVTTPYLSNVYLLSLPRHFVVPVGVVTGCVHSINEVKTGGMISWLI